MRYAHSGRQADRSDWQTLRSHLKSTAKLGATRGRPLGLEAAARAAGWLHDLGKYDPEFDSRLSGETIRFDHSTAGAALLGTIAGPRERLAAELLAYGILGHHAGLPNRRDDSAGSLEQRLERFEDRLDSVWRDEVGVDLAGASAELAAKALPGRDAAFSLSVAARMAFSCLVDADFRDTEAYYADLDGNEPDRDWPTLQSLLPDLSAALDARLASLPADGDLNALRGSVLAHARERSTMAPGLFTFTVPTGGGKTLASMAFALAHARAHDLRRIVYVIPYTSIIDQTATVFRDIFGEATVLEHHSAIDDETPTDAGRGGRDKLRLAMEDWAAPIVVTTNVQLFESLFAARPSRARKLHNLAGAVIVLDEAQALPRDLLSPTLKMIDTLVRAYGCSVVLCTATQPAFDSARLKGGGLALAGRELAPDPDGLAQRLRRATVRIAGALSDDELIEALGETEQGLVIVNTRAHALALFHAAKAAELDGVVHLTTRQCAAHRLEILADIRARLKPGGGAPCRVIATSLVEAGVDLDFPRVWRAEAGLDSIVQAAGRCNREGRRPAEDSLVTVFAAPDHPGSAEVRKLADAMRRVAKTHKDLLSPTAMRAWFEEVYWDKDALLDRHGILDRFRVTSAGAEFAFRDVAKLYRMVETTMVPVITPRDEAAETRVRELGVEAISSGRIARALQRHVVQVPARARARLVACGHAGFAHPDLRGDQFCVLKTRSLYREDSGLNWEDADYLAVESTIV
ncbi:MAG: CRISPR-associated endonuclease Cas3'' [Pseudomonadota bacterium]|nr:CRISPR-associated endonuclease Cas3'' [Pseudomonadota bacterium]